MAERFPLDFFGRLKHQVDYGVALRNEVTNGDFSDGTTGWPASAGTSNASNNIYSLTGDGTGVAPYTDTLITGNADSLFLDISFSVDNALCSSLSVHLYGSTSGSLFNVVSQASPNQDQIYRKSAIIDASTLVGDITVRVLEVYPDAGTANGKVMKIDGTAGVFAINRTEMGITHWSESDMLTSVQTGFWDFWKMFVEKYSNDPLSIMLNQNYPLVQSADLTDTLIDDHTLDEPTNAVVEVAGLNYQIGNQIFSKVDSGDLTKFLVYDRVMTNEEIAKILLFLGTGEFALDSDGDFAIDSNGDMAAAPKSEYYL
jgi:hypothetical protein